MNHPVKDHINGVHFDLMPFECVECKKSFKNTFQLRHHLEENHQRLCIKKLSELLKCNDCETFFLSGHDFKTHVDEVHKKMNKYNCHYCNASFSQMLHLQDHEDRSHSNKKTQG